MTTSIALSVQGGQVIPFADRLNRGDLIAHAEEMVATFDPSKLTLQTVLQIGREAERDLGASLDSILSEFSSENSPFVFEAFQELQQGLRAANLDELEEKIAEARKPGPLGVLLGVFGIRKLSKQKLAEFGAMLNNLLKGKKQTLLDLVRKMEDGARKESEALMKTMERFDKLAQGHLSVADEFAVNLLYIDRVLEKAKEHSHLLSEKVEGVEDVSAQFQAKQYEELIVHLQNRRLLLMTAYEKTPTELEMIAMSKKVAANTFIEVSSSLIQQLNSVKTALAKWAMLITIENSQQGDRLRREIAEELLKHGVAVLDRVAVVAAETPYQRRLADAEILLAMRQGLSTIHQKVLQIEQVGQESFAKAEGILLESRRQLAISNVS